MFSKLYSFAVYKFTCYGQIIAQGAFSFLLVYAAAKRVGKEDVSRLRCLSVNSANTALTRRRVFFFP